LSGGEQQRVAIARALSRRPKLILADEPTGNLDRKTGGHVIDLLFGLQRRRGATLILVTHDERLAGACERTIRMADGRIEGATELVA
jgi:putative ABC transport system ATP-binding protein